MVSEIVSSIEVIAVTLRLLAHATVRFGPIGWLCRLLGLGWGPGNRAGRVREDRPGRGHRLPRVRKGPRRPDLTFSPIFEPGRAVVLPVKDSFSRSRRTPRTFKLHRFFTILASEPSNSIDFSLFWPQNLQIILIFHYSGASRAIGCKVPFAEP